MNGDRIEKFMQLVEVGFGTWNESNEVKAKMVMLALLIMFDYLLF
jgi:hypothetical protein